MTNRTKMEAISMELQHELRRAKEERFEALEELEEIKNRMIIADDVAADDENRIIVLESELKKTRESERTMLESLTSQTKLLEQTKILLEEAKLEIVSLNETVRIFELSTKDAAGALAVRNELKQALDAEDKSKRAMDELAAVLKEVTTESNLLKMELMDAKAELDTRNEESIRLESLLHRTESRIEKAMEESKRVKYEAEESVAAWAEKEASFLQCMTVCEDEMASLRRENDKLANLEALAREETSRVRDILKHAVTEATIVKEALEIARGENGQLQEQLARKEDEFQELRREMEAVRAREAAAIEGFRELQELVVAGRTRSSCDTDSLTEPSARLSGLSGLSKSGRRYSFGDSDRFEGSIFDNLESPPQQKKKSPAVTAVVKGGGKAISFDNSVNFDDSVNFDERKIWDSPAQQKKKRQILRKFSNRMGDMIRRKSFKQ